MVVSIKIRFERQIRRISFDNEQLGFDELASSTAQIFNRPRESLGFKYIDDEQDLIDISTDVELREALRINQGKTLQVVVYSSQPRHFQHHPYAQQGCRGRWGGFGRRGPFAHHQNQGGENSIPQDRKFVHNAYCDLCQSTIVGIRYKCNQCPDYDLCENCISKKDEVHDTTHSFADLKGNNENNNRVPPFFRCGRGDYAQQGNPLSQLFNNLLKDFNVEVTIENPDEKPYPQSNPQEEKQEEKVEEEKKNEEELPQAPEVQESESDVANYEEALKQLEHMGFLDRESNIQALELNKGDVVASIACLLD